MKNTRPKKFLTRRHNKVRVRQPIIAVTSLLDREWFHTALGVTVVVSIIVGALVCSSRAYRGDAAADGDPSATSFEIQSLSLAQTFTVINTNDSGAGSLRQAILDANVTAGTDTISFNIPGSGVQTISPVTSLPAIIDPVNIDGYTQPFAISNTLAVGDDAVLLILISGASAPLGTNGLTLNTDSSTIRGLVINGFQATAGGNGGNGIAILAGADANVIEGNFIGTNPSGSSAVANATGVQVLNASDNLIGGTTPSERNLLSGNARGIYVLGTAATSLTALRNLVKGNYIGTNAAGTAAVGNTGVGIYLQGGVSDTVVGGTTAAARNIISGNTGSGPCGAAVSGVLLGALLQPFPISEFRSPFNTSIQGNFIGLNAAGTAAVANQAGISIFTSVGFTIGGTGAGTGNVISGNTCDGIYHNLDLVLPSSAPSGPTLIQGNFIGTNPAGDAAIGNGLGGINVNGAGGLTIGGNTDAARNVISGNGRDGIRLEYVSHFNFIQRNYIGTTIGLAPLGNAGHGIFITDSSTFNFIGSSTGTGSGDGNLIANNTLSGISVTGTASSNNFTSNSIYSNGGLGIDLGNNGVTPNDAGDGDIGPNNLQNFPVLTSAISDGSNTTIQGTLSSTANTTFRIEFFSNSTCDVSGNGEGENFLGFTSVTTTGNDAAINVVLPFAVTPGQFLTSTATDPTNNTSEFSACRLVTPASIPCTLACPSNIAQSSSAGQCGAVVNYTAPTTSGDCGTVSCAPASGSFFAVGTTTVNCTATGASCSFTVSITDTQAPTIACPSNITAAVSSGQSCAVVTFPAPVASDNCSAVTTICVPPSGTCFPLGTTTVACRATDAANNVANCSLTVRVSMFDVCIQDDSDQSRVLLFSSITGDYVLCCEGVRVSGRGTVTRKGGEIALLHNPTDWRLQAKVSIATKKGSAALQMPPATMKCTIIDRDITNDSCNCATS